MKQYELWWAILPAPAGRRPVLLLSRDSAYAFLNSFLAVEVTTQIRRIATEVPLGRAEGLSHTSVANFDNVRAVPRGALKQRIGRLAPARHGEVKRAFGRALGWDELLGAP